MGDLWNRVERSWLNDVKAGRTAATSALALSIRVPILSKEDVDVIVHNKLQEIHAPHRLKGADELMARVLASRSLTAFGINVCNVSHPLILQCVYRAPVSKNLSELHLYQANNISISMFKKLAKVMRHCQALSWLTLEYGQVLPWGMLAPFVRQLRRLSIGTVNVGLKDIMTISQAFKENGNFQSSASKGQQTICNVNVARFHLYPSPQSTASKGHLRYELWRVLFTVIEKQANVDSLLMAPNVMNEYLDDQVAEYCKFTLTKSLSLHTVYSWDHKPVVHKSPLILPAQDKN